MLRIERENRIRPGLDDKSLVGWNGLMIGALAEAGIWPLAQNAVVGLLAAQKTLGRLPHQISKGVPSGFAFLEDYAFLADGILKLAAFFADFEEAGELPPQAIPPDALFEVAGRLCQEMVEKFYDEKSGGFFGTSEQHEQLFGRTKPVFDQPLPSANAIAIRCLIQIGELKRARHSIEGLLGWMQRAPHATEALLTTSMMLLAMEKATGEAPVPILEIPVPAPIVSAPAAPTALVEVSISSREMQAGPDGFGRGTITLKVPEGMHINSDSPPARWLVPTKLSFNGVKGQASYPVSMDDQFRGEVPIGFAVELPKGESGAEFEIKVSWQACTESECQAPQEKTFTAVVLR